MVCYRPLEAWRGSTRTENGKRALVFRLSEGHADQAVMVPCGQCIGCRLEYSRQWAMRIMHEAQLYDENCFITLTYDDPHLPYPPTLRVDHFQKFMKRFRKSVPNGVRFFHAGEYGSDTSRPHYHACIFGWSFPDRRVFSKNGENLLYTSESLSNLWPFGFASVGELSFESAAYVARYVTKKINGDQAQAAYAWTDPETGEVFSLKPEYCTMSRRPGVGAEWYDRYSADVYPSDMVVVRGVPTKPPKAYDKFLERDSPEIARAVKGKRAKNGKKRKADSTSSRLKTRETVKSAQITTLKRSL